MALTLEFVNQHIQFWQHQFRDEYLPYKKKWPSRVFRHDPLENIAEVLRSGILLSRDASSNARVLDCAPEDIVNRTGQAHSYTRFYFRPRTPTQFHVEGIRKVEEYYNGAHIPMIGMMIFDARQILTNPDVQFSTCNMQREDAVVGNNEEFFSQNMDFERIYHTGGIGNDRTIPAKRCAEVLLGSPLQINGLLQHVFCRSDAERHTLIHLLGDQHAKRWADKIVVSDDMKVFERKFTYVESVKVSSDGLVIQLAPRTDNREVKINIIARENSNSGRIVLEFSRSQFSPRRGNIRRWKIPHAFVEGNYFVEIKLEDCLAFRDILSHIDVPF